MHFNAKNKEYLKFKHFDAENREKNQIFFVDFIFLYKNYLGHLLYSTIFLIF